MRYPDFDRAFGKTPDAIHDNIIEGIERGEKAMKFRSKIIWMASAAAALVVIVAVAALAAGGLELGKPKQDIVLGQQYSPAPSQNTLESTFYYTEKGTYFHAIPDCSGMQGAQAHSLREAYASGKGACPVCVDWEELSATPTPRPMPDSETTVFCTENGAYYHAYADCSGMMNAHASTIEQAEAEGKVPCPVCLSADANAWFAANATPEPTYPPTATYENSFSFGIPGADGPISVFITAPTPAPTAAAIAEKYGLMPTLTPMPTPMAMDVGISAAERVPAVDVFSALFGMDAAKAFPDYALVSSMESLPAGNMDSEALYSSLELTDGENSITIELTPVTEEQDGTFSIIMDDSAAAEQLMENAPEPLRGIHMDSAADAIRKILSAARQDAAQTWRLGDVLLTYSKEMDMTYAELTYYTNDGSIVVLGWNTSEAEPCLRSIHWAA